jgi:glutamate N-acetyltransferase/amino-acid N-acetyltransferase|tara:strand:- start:974 stop:2149 length:1176 start_codon:yes stop_codon:yes gene_type:complete
MFEEIKIGCSSSGSKYGTRLDTTIVKLEKKAIWSGLFTSNKFKSAPVEICLEKINKNISEPKILMINAGNANAATGKKGKKDSEKLIDEVSRLLNVSKDNILPFSTGVVGELLDTKKLSQAFKKCTDQIGKSSWKDFANAIMTTDTRHKIVQRKFTIGNQKVNVIGIAKGVGMIEPNMATTLSFVFTDLKLSKTQLKRLHKDICDQTFNAISIDGDQSPSDSSIFASTSEKKGDIEKYYNKIKDNFFEVFRELAEKLVLDGEGATKLIKIRVSGLSSYAASKKVALKVANSPLVKTAAYGEDPNWGRIITAAGNADEREFDMKNLSLKIGDYPVLINGNLSPKYSEVKGKKEFRKKTINIEIKLGKSKHSALIMTSDLSPEYISINSDYRS